MTRVAELTEAQKIANALAAAVKEHTAHQVTARQLLAVATVLLGVGALVAGLH